MIRRHAKLLIILFAIAVTASVVIHLVVTWRSIAGYVQSSKRHAIFARAKPVDPAAIVPLASSGRNTDTAGISADAAVLGLELRGVVVGFPPSASAALIAVSGTPAKTFVIGDALPGGAMLDAIEFDLIVLRVNSQLRTLGFARSPASSAAAPSALISAAGEPGGTTGGPAARGFELRDHGMVEPRGDAAGNIGGQLASDLSRAGPAPGNALSGNPAAAVNRHGGIVRASDRAVIAAPSQ